MFTCRLSGKKSYVACLLLCTKQEHQLQLALCQLMLLCESIYSCRSTTLDSWTEEQLKVGLLKTPYALLPEMHSFLCLALYALLVCLHWVCRAAMPCISNLQYAPMRALRLGCMHCRLPLLEAISEDARSSSNMAGQNLALTRLSKRSAGTSSLLD